MPLQGATQEINNFVKGIITEATALNFPPNATSDEQNFDLNRDGSRRRRFGIDYESDFVKTDTGFTESSIKAVGVNTFLWDNVENNDNLHLVVIQVKDKLWFVDRYATTFSTAFKNGGSALTLSNVYDEDFDAVSIEGKLVLIARYKDPTYLSYNSSTDTVTATPIYIKVRDFWGVSDGLATTTRPVSLSNTHRYNLFNQGWTISNALNVRTNEGVYPSNADVQHLAKDSDEVFQSSLLVKQFFGSSPAPKGRYIISPFSRGTDRKSQSGISSGLPSDNVAERPSVGTSYAGRMFYAGVRGATTNGDSNSPTISSMIFFSKVVESVNDLSICYQEADPSSEHISDIIDNDGGFVVIPEANHVIKLMAINGSLAVFADNGVWEIYGDTGGFTATSYQVSKVSNTGALGKKSIIEAEDTILYWGEAGIYTLATDPTSGRLVSSNITEGTIQTLYNGLNGDTREHAKGCFDESNRKISWLYSDDSSYNGTDFKYKYNKELVLDFALKAFYIRSLKELTTDSPYIVDCIKTPSFVNLDNVQDVEVNGTEVQVNGTTVTVTRNVLTGALSAMKYLTIIPSSGGNYYFTFSEYRNTNFLDWYSEDSVGVDAAAYLETGQNVFEDTQRGKQVPYITFHFVRTETGFETVGSDLLAVGESSCLVQARWDFSNHSNSGKYGSQFQAYRLKRNYIPSGASDPFDYGHSVITTKNKLRGKGRALSLYLSTEATKDCYILGWGLNVTQAQAV
jgi:hypothetical protein